MRIRVVSDLHVEFHRDGGATLVAEIVAGDFDVLVVAGDLSDAVNLMGALRLLAISTPKPIVYVHGNHEFYGGNRASVLQATCDAEQRHPNLHFLDNDAVTIDGQRFVGTPLWFSRSDAPKWAMNDFSQITEFGSWVYEQNAEAMRFLREEVQPGDVVVTHYLPVPESVHPRFAGSPLNPFFLCDVSDTLHERRPKVWIHGHTHCGVNRRVGPTLVVANPHGYPGESPDFEPKFTVEV